MHFDKDKIGIGIAAIGAVAAIAYYMQSSRAAGASQAAGAGAGMSYPLFQSAALPASVGGAGGASTAPGASAGPGFDLSGIINAVTTIGAAQVQQPTNHDLLDLGQALFAQLGGAQSGQTNMHGDFSLRDGAVNFDWHSDTPLAPVVVTPPPLPPAAVVPSPVQTIFGQPIPWPWAAQAEQGGPNGGANGGDFAGGDFGGGQGSTGDFGGGDFGSADGGGSHGGW